MTATQQQNISPGSDVEPASWLPMIVIALVQIQLSFNVNALVISMGDIVDDLGISATTVGTALVVYSLAVAGLVMLGAKIGAAIGSRLAFQLGVLGHGVSMAVMVFSVNAVMMNVAQAIAGITAALAVPALVVMIATHYRGKQQEQSLGFLGAAQAISSALAFLVVGFLSLFVSWRWSFVLLVVVAAANLYLSVRLKRVEPQAGVKIDFVGAILAAIAVTLVSLGLNSINAWGLLVATTDSPFHFLGLSPSPVMIIGGVLFGQSFFAWLRRRQAQHKSQILALDVLDTREERSATISLLIVAALGPAVNFLLPLYIQIVQGRSTGETAVAVIPYALAIFVGTTFVVRIYGRLAPRQIGRYGFIMVAAGLFLLAYVIHNDWGTPAVIFSLIVIGLGEGALLTLVFNVLVSASPKELAGYVGALRGTTNNLATGLGTAFASLLAVATFSLVIATYVADSPTIPPELVEELEGSDLDDSDFVSGDELEDALNDTSATEDQIDEALRINSDAQLRALKISFQVLAGLALLGIIPASGMPPYRPEEVTVREAQTLVEHEDDELDPAHGLNS